MSDTAHGSGSGEFGKLAMVMGCAVALAALISWATGYPFLTALTPLAAVGFLGYVLIRGLPKIRGGGHSRHYATSSAGWHKRMGLVAAVASFIALCLVALGGWATVRAVVTTLWVATTVFVVGEFWRRGHRAAGVLVGGFLAAATAAPVFPMLYSSVETWPTRGELELASVTRVEVDAETLAFRHRETSQRQLGDQLRTRLELIDQAVMDGVIGSDEAVEKKGEALREYGEKIAKLEETLRVGKSMSKRLAEAANSLTEKVSKLVSGTEPLTTGPTRPSGVPENAVRFALEPGEDWCPTENTKVKIKGEDGREFAFVDTETGHAPTAVDGADYSGTGRAFCIRGGELGAAIWVWPTS